MHKILLVFTTLIVLTTASPFTPKSEEIKVSKEVNDFLELRDSKHAEINLNFHCNNSITDCDNHGTCNPEPPYNCACDDSHTTHPTDSKIQCNYKRKNQIAAFCIAFFVGWTGAFYFYMGHMGLGAGQLVLTFVSIPLACFACCAGVTKKGGALAVVYMVLIVLAALAVAGWDLAVVIIAAIGDFKDNNGIEMERW